MTSIGTQCYCRGKAFAPDSGCVHSDRCERRHARLGEFLTLHDGVPMCGGCRVLLGDDKKRVEGDIGRARDEYIVAMGQLRLI